MLAGGLMGMARAGMQDQQTLARINAMYRQAGWEEDYGDQILDQANTSSKRMKRTAYRNSIGIMNKSAMQSMQIKARAERNASSLIVKARQRSRCQWWHSIGGSGNADGSR